MRRLVLMGLLWALVPHMAEAQTVTGDRFQLNTGPCTLRSGSGAPSTSLGAVCDVYVNTASPYTIYVKTASATWASISGHTGGAAPYVAGDILYASDATTLARLADVGAGSVLISSAGNPAWSAAPSVTTLTAATSVTTPLLTATGAMSITPASGNLTLDPSGDVILNPTGNDALPTTNYDINLGSLSQKYLTLHAAELWVETLVAQHTIATIGGRIVVTPTATLASDLTTGATSGNFSHNHFVTGEYALLQSAGKFEVIKFASGSYNYTCPCFYYFDRNLDGTGANTWYAGDAVASLGAAAGNGFMDLYSYNSFTARHLQYAYNYNATGAVFSANYAESDPWRPWDDGAGTEVNDAVYYGADSTFLMLTADVIIAGLSGTSTRVWEYWNGSAWTSFSPTTPDGLITPVGKNTVSWTSLSGWATTTVNSVSAYWVRNRISVCSSCTAITPASVHRTVRESQAWGPSIVGMVRTSASNWNDIAPRWAVGNLNGWYGYGTDIYGAAFGDYSNSYLTLDATNGIRMIGDLGTMFSMDASGNATFAGNLTIGAGRNMLANAEFVIGRGSGDRYASYWGGSDSTSTVSPSDAYTCAGTCSQRASHGSGWSWTGADEDHAGTMLIGVAAAANAPLGSSAVYFQASGTPANTTYGRIFGPVVPVDEDLIYEYSAYIANSATWTTQLGISWFGVDGADGGDQPDYLSASTMTTGCASALSGLYTDIGNWCRAWGIVDPPANARLAQLYVIATYDGGDASPVVFVTRPYFAQAYATAQTEPTPWGPGGQTLITGDMLATDLVMANTIRSEGATSATAGTGFWVDATGTPTFRVGEAVSAGNDYLYWNGTTLDIGGTITSTNGTIGGWTIATDYIASAIGGLNTDSGDSVTLWVGTTYANRANAKFQVNPSGVVTLSATCQIESGSGSPEGSVTAPVCSLYLRANGGAGTTLYVKESGTGNTGWVGK